MIVLDFLVYYLTYWFEKNNDKVSWSTPIQRSSYAVGLMTIGLLYSINEYFELGGIKSLQFHIPKLLYLAAALAIMKLYEYIYTTRNRYQMIVREIPKKFAINDDTGATICIAITFLSILSPFIITTILVPFGGHTLANR